MFFLIFPKGIGTVLCCTATVYWG